MKSVNGNIVRVAFNAKIGRDGGEERADTVECIHGISTQGCRAALEESDLAKAEHDALASIAQRDNMMLKFVGETEFKLMANRFGTFSGARRMGCVDWRCAGEDGGIATRARTHA